jgi:hypothetical protein
MKALVLIILGVVLSLLSGQTAETRKGQASKNRNPIITSFSSCPEKVVRCYSLIQYDCTAEDASLTVVATDPDGDYLTYRYRVSGGTITGQGSSVRWNLKGVPDGNVLAQVFVTDRRGGETTSELLLIITTAPLPDPPPCPVIMVNCADKITVDKHALFTVEVSGGPAAVPITYHWTVPRGKIVKGQDTKVLEVETVDRAQESITARVRIGGFDPSCFTEASCTTNVLRQLELLPHPCPHVEVSCPDRLDVNGRALFSARVAEAEDSKSVSYYWTVNWGKIIGGQGTSKIEVEHKERWGEKLTATVTVGGYDPSCNAQASCSLPLSQD